MAILTRIVVACVPLFLTRRDKLRFSKRSWRMGLTSLLGFCILSPLSACDKETDGNAAGSPVTVTKPSAAQIAFAAKAILTDLPGANLRWKWQDSVSASSTKSSRFTVHVAAGRDQIFTKCKPNLWVQPSSRQNANMLATRTNRDMVRSHFEIDRTTRSTHFGGQIPAYLEGTDKRGNIYT